MPSTIETRALFSPLKVGSIALEHRIAMAPLTRFRANDEHEHEDVAIEYYTQRATPGGLLITEATLISPASSGYPNIPQIYTPEQILRWKKIVDAVHAKGGKLIMQLWSLGRAAGAETLQAQGGFDVVSASDIPFEGGATPRPLTIAEIAEFTADYAQAAKNFIEGAGGDGVEIHGANGYLIDQFFQTTSNKRTDKYGGSVENRVRFGREVVAAVVAAVGAEKVGIRLSPYSTFQGMKMAPEDIKETFTYIVETLKADHDKLAYIHVVEARIAGNATIEAPVHEELDFLYKIWTPRAFLVAGGFETASAIKEAEARANTVVVFGRHFIPNPDLVRRIKEDLPFRAYDRATFYQYGPKNTEGYTSYLPYDDDLKI